MEQASGGDSGRLRVFQQPTRELNLTKTGEMPVHWEAGGDH